MTIERYTITVGNNTSVTGTSYKLDDAQLKQLEALVKSGDILLDPSKGVITVKTAKGLVSAGAIAGVSVDELMEIDDLPAEIFRGMTHESAMAAINRFSTTDPKEMSLSELMSYMFMLIYQSESDRREALQTAKGAQLLIQMQQAAMQWAQSREAAEKEYANALTSAIGQIVGGAISAGMSVAGGITQSVANKRSRIAENKKTELKKAELAKKYNELKKDKELKDEAFKAEVDERVRANSDEIKEENDKLKTINENELTIKSNKKAIKDNELTIKDNKEKIDKLNPKNDQAEIDRLKAENTKLEDQNKELEVKNEQLKQTNENFGPKTTIEDNVVRLTNDNEALGRDINGKPIEGSKPDYLKSTLGDNPKYQAKVESDAKLAECEGKILKLGGTINDNGTITSNGVPWGKVKIEKADGSYKLQDIEASDLKKEEEKAEKSAKKWGIVANTLQSSAVGSSAAVQGFSGIFAAHHAKDAAFLRAEAQLTDAFRNFASSQVQNIDSSAEQALRQLGTLISSLKEVFRAMYDIECSMARNI